MDKDLKNKELEEVSGGSTEFYPKPQIEPIPIPIPSPGSPAVLICRVKNKGTEACNLVRKGKLTECSDCSKNHD